MKNIIIILIGLCFWGCNFKEIKKKISEEHKKDSLRIDSIRLKKIEDSTLILKFKKWMNADSSDITYINTFFKNDIDLKRSSDLDFVILKTKANVLSLIIKKNADSRFNHGYWIQNDITRSNWEDFNFGTEAIDLYKIGRTYFKLIITPDNKIDTTITIKYPHFGDEDFLKTISEHIKDKIQVEEFFEREDVGHFEGDKKPDDKKVRSFYLAVENKQAIKESYMLFLLLDKDVTYILNKE